MATTKIKAKCILCGETLSEGLALFVGVVNLTKKAKSDYGWYRHEELPEDLLRIQHKQQSKPRGGIHVACWEEMMALWKNY